MENTRIDAGKLIEALKEQRNQAMDQLALCQALIAQLQEADKDKDDRGDG